MSNGIGRSKKNLPSDANHVSANDKAETRQKQKNSNHVDPMKLKYPR
ncbi:MAG: hypothetical protein ACI35O_16760 [Bacillaceae bacterium]